MTKKRLANMNEISESIEAFAKGTSRARPMITLSLEEAKKLCDRLEFDASWDKVGSSYYSMKNQIREIEGGHD